MIIHSSGHVLMVTAKFDGMNYVGVVDVEEVITLGSHLYIAFQP